MEKTIKKHLSVFLAIIMLLTLLVPTAADAADNSLTEGDTAAMVSDYGPFLSCLKTLEDYAQDYAKENTDENVNALIINYIRTGVERYGQLGR